MAKIVFGGLISDARNKEGGLVYSRNRSGSFSRAWFKPPNPQTPRQQANRALWKTTLDRWSGTLTEAQRKAWNAYADAHPTSHAKIGQGRRTGQHWFLHINFSTRTWTGTFVDDPPANLKAFQCGAILQFEIDTAAATITLQTAKTPTIDELTEVWMTRSISLGVSRIYTGLTIAFTAATNPVDPAALYAAYISQNPTPQPGQKFGLMARGHRKDNGLKGVPFYATCIATPTGEAMLQAEVTITDTQIKALPTTPIQLVATPGPGKVLVFHSILIAKLCSAGAYTNISAGPATPYIVPFQLPGTVFSSFAINDAAAVPPNTALSDLLAADNTIFRFFPQTQYNANPGHQFVTEATLDNTSANTPLLLACSNPAGNFTGGNAANSWKVTTFYSIVGV